jgi:hypothetical protein
MMQAQLTIHENSSGIANAVRGLAWEGMVRAVPFLAERWQEAIAAPPARGNQLGKHRRNKHRMTGRPGQTGPATVSTELDEARLTGSVALRASAWQTPPRPSLQTTLDTYEDTIAALAASGAEHG